MEQVMDEKMIRQMSADMDKDELTTCIVAINSFLTKGYSLMGDRKGAEKLQEAMSIYPQDVQLLVTGIAMNMVTSMLGKILEDMKGGE